MAVKADGRISYVRIVAGPAARRLSAGEWAVAASLVAEVFPKHARTHASGIFHASSVVGTWMAAIAGIAVGTQWRLAYLIGIIPALLVVWVRRKLRTEPCSTDTFWKTGSSLPQIGSLAMNSMSTSASSRLM